ncbi:MAG: DUF2079 domain-containing protein [Chloroflexi bacterium]|nr:MAG: DUF2079 domain-containing protein [Chloroflexota bacterium]
MFLPVLSPLFLVAIPELLERFWSSNPALWSASFHYSLVIAPVLAFASIDTLARIRRMLPDGLSELAVRGVSIAVLGAGLILTFGIVRPLDELGTYTWVGQAAQIQSCLDVIPADASVSASDALTSSPENRPRSAIRSPAPYPVAMESPARKGRRWSCSSAAATKHCPRKSRRSWPRPNRRGRSRTWLSALSRSAELSAIDARRRSSPADLR